MDAAKNFKPDVIYLWNRISDNFEARRIISLFKNTEVKIIKNQKLTHSDALSSAEVLLKSKKVLMIGSTSSFINHFDGNIGNNMRCFPYYKLVPLSNGCPYHCVYCYLAYVYRRYGAFIKININYSKMLEQIQKLSLQSQNKICFNLGEMLDSLAFDHITNISSLLIPFFGNLKNSYLMMLTKSCNIDNLLKLKPNNQVVVSWSLNPQTIIDNYELGTADLEERINAAKQCQQHGYRIRFRIDPGILCDNWKREYASLIEKIFRNTEPENITIGTLRLFKGHTKLSQKAYNINSDLFASLCETAEDGKLRYSTEKRIEFYKFMIENISSYNKTSLAICREDNEIYQHLNFKPQICNCIA
ncbi:MAG: hypothetical protein LLF92_05370 [Planctomycetaceae bacterium]|nr:hypothetical protein [Planctomycetaceae bacterium]